MMGDQLYGLDWSVLKDLKFNPHAILVFIQKMCVNKGKSHWKVLLKFKQKKPIQKYHILPCLYRVYGK